MGTVIAFPCEADRPLTTLEESIVAQMRALPASTLIARCGGGELRYYLEKQLDAITAEADAVPAMGLCLAFQEHALACADWENIAARLLAEARNPIALTLVGSAGHRA